MIECDGPIHETNEDWQHDQARSAYMVGYGLRVLRFTNEEVLNNTEGNSKTKNSLSVVVDRFAAVRRKRTARNHEIDPPFFLKFLKNSR